MNIFVLPNTKENIFSEYWWQNFHFWVTYPFNSKPLPLRAFKAVEFWSVSLAADFPAEPLIQNTVLTLEHVQFWIKLSIGVCRWLFNGWVCTVRCGLSQSQFYLLLPYCIYFTIPATASWNLEGDFIVDLLVSQHHLLFKCKCTV